MLIVIRMGDAHIKMGVTKNRSKFNGRHLFAMELLARDQVTRVSAFLK